VLLAWLDEGARGPEAAQGRRAIPPGINASTASAFRPNSPGLPPVHFGLSTGLPLAGKPGRGRPVLTASTFPSGFTVAAGLGEPTARVRRQVPLQGSPFRVAHANGVKGSKAGPVSAAVSPTIIREGRYRAGGRSVRAGP
jgi:hypothetical protein